MKSSMFNKIFPLDENGHKFLIYNTFHDHQIVLTNGDLLVTDFFIKIALGKELNSEEQSVASELAKLGILLDKNVDELKAFNNWFIHKVRDDCEYLNVTIVTSMKCNLDCEYCYEKQIATSDMMTEETARSLVSFLFNKINTSSPGKIHIEFYGGEPMTNMNAITYIAETMGHYCKWSEKNLSMGITTNGTLLTKKNADKLRKSGINRLKITLDGSKECHDKKRFFRGSQKGTFETIFNNLNNNCNDFEILIGGNFDDDNFNSFPILIEEIKKSKFRDKLQQVNFKPIIKNFGHKKVSCHMGTNPPSNDPDKGLSQMLYLRKLVDASDLPTSKQIALGPCEFYRKNSLTIDTNGEIYSCPAFIGRKNFILGNINLDKHSKRRDHLNTLKPWQQSDDCQQCSNLPICAGGCRANAWNQNKRIEDISCNKEFFNQIINSVIVSPLTENIT